MSVSPQLSFEGFEKCRCWRIKESSGTVLAGYSCPECLERALDFLEDLLYLDKVHSVSGPVSVEESHG